MIIPRMIQRNNFIQGVLEKNVHQKGPHLYSK